jgi:prophage antirepressor-like protein
VNELQVFRYHGRDFRAIEQDGQPWFILSDVCRVLGLGTPSRVAERLDPDEKGMRQIHTPGGPQDMTIINESGLYAVILRSDKPEAKPFRKWVTAEVLPTIRATGAYGAPQAAPAITDALERMTGVVEALASRIEALEHQAQEVPRAELIAPPDLSIPRTTRRHWMRKFNEKLETLEYNFNLSKPAILRRLYDMVEKKFDTVLDEERFRYIEKTGQEECSVLEIIYRNEQYRAYFQHIIDQKLGPEYWDW